MRVVVMFLVLATLGLAACGGGSEGNESTQIASVVGTDHALYDEYVERPAADRADSLRKIGFRRAATDVVSDDFERAVLGSSWNIHVGNPGIVSGSDLGLLSGSFGMVSWAAPLPADQFSEAEISADINPQMDKQVFVRRRAADRARYAFHWQPTPGEWQLKYDGVPGSQTRILASGKGVPPSPGDVLRIEVRGTTLSGYLNGALVLKVSDTRISAGQPGMAFGKIGSFVAQPSPVFERWAGGALAPPEPKIVRLSRSRSLVLYSTGQPACFSVRFVSNTRFRHTFTVTNARKRVVWKDVGLGEAGRPTLIKWCGRTKAKTPTQGKPLPVGRYRAKLEVSVAPAGKPPAPIAFFARTWPLEMRT